MNSKIKIYFFPEVTVREKKNVSHCLILFSHHINFVRQIIFVYKWNQDFIELDHFPLVTEL